MKLVHPSILPGFLELLPKDQKLFNEMKDTIEKTFQIYGFLPIETPVIEKKEVLLAKGGGETTKQIYSIDSSSKDMALRFDLTVPLARYVAEHYQDLQFPFKRYQIDRVYRGERNQKGRYKEFYQCDIDVIGDGKLSLNYDSEVLAVMNKAFENLKVDKLKFHVNNRKLLNGFFLGLEITDTTDLLRLIDKKSKLDKGKFNELLEGLLKDQIKREEVNKFIQFDDIDLDNSLQYLEEKRGLNTVYDEGLDELKSLVDGSVKLGVKRDNILIDTSITRGLDYYTGNVFESFITGYESIGSVCSGGRYFDLANNYTDRELPGVGMSIGLTRLFYSLSANNLIAEENNTIDLLILTMTDSFDYAIECTNILRQHGVKSSIYYEEGKFKKKMAYANKLGAKYIIIIGEDEIEKKLVSLKNMATGEQSLLSLDESIKIIKG